MEGDDLAIAVIGDFYFCGKHGSELCNKCCCDYRSGNNPRILKKLSQDFPDYSEEDFMDRPPLSNAYGFGAVLSKTRDPKSHLYECKQHAKVDCSVCFDWGKLVTARIKFVAKNQDMIEIDASREDKLGFLSAMGVGLTPSTKLPESAVNRKLRSALDAAQALMKVVDHTPFNPSTLPIWSSNQPKDVFDSIIRLSHAESMESPASLFDDGDAFMDLRSTLMWLAKFCDAGRGTAILQDKDQEFAVLIRIVNTFVIKDNVPVIVLLYARATRATPLKSTLDWIGSHAQSDEPLSQITVTPQGQVLLLTLLAMNSSRLSSEYKPKRANSERTFTASFLIPVGPLTQQDVGRLTSKSGCAVCGKRTASKCSACLSAEYCSAVCQKADWKEHKSLCNSLKGGVWFPVTVSVDGEDARRAVARGEKLDPELSYHNLRSPMNEAGIRIAAVSAAGPPPNIHGEKPFLIKIQLPTHLHGHAMLIYDRQRSIQVHLFRSDDLDAYRKAEEAMSTGYKGLKIYRWAKRVGDLQLSVCFDRAPPKDPQW